MTKQRDHPSYLLQIKIQLLSTPDQTIQKQIPILHIPHQTVLAFDHDNVKPVQQQVLIKPLILIPAMCRCTASRLDIGINQLPALRFHASAGFLDLIFQGIQLGFFCGTGAAVNYRTFHARSGSLRIKFSKRRYSEGVKNSSPFRISAIFVIKFFSFTGTFLLSLKIMPAKLVAYQDIAKKIIILL